MNRYNVMNGLLVGTALLVSFGCAQTGRIVSSDEPTLVGARSAGADVYNKLIDETLRKLLEQSKGAAQSKKSICFVDVENKGAEELGENKAAIYEQIDTIIVESGVYANVSRRYVEAALRQTGLRPDEIFLGQGRQQFMLVLGSQGVTPDYLLWGTVTNLSTDGVNLREREYMLTMELVNARTGLTEAKKTSKMRKEYTK
jgi:hypothetical protein